MLFVAFLLDTSPFPEEITLLARLPGAPYVFYKEATEPMLESELQDQAHLPDPEICNDDNPDPQS